MSRSAGPFRTRARCGHVTGEALYTDDLLGSLSALLHAWPVMSPHAHAVVTSSRCEPRRYASRAWSPCSRGADVPGEGDTGAVRHDEPLFPSEVMFHSQPVAWVLGETLEAARARRRAVSSSTDRCSGHAHDRRGDRGRKLSHRPAAIAARRHVGDRRRARSGIEASSRIGGQEHFYLETQARSRGSTRPAASSLHSSTQHPAETQEIVARVLGAAAQPGHGRVPAHGRRVRRQGSAGQRVGGGRRARRVEDRPAGARAADARAGHGAHRQAASVPGALRRRLRG